MLRLLAVPAEVISLCPNAFITGRLITENVFIATEVMQYMTECKGRKKLWAALQVDFQKQ